MARRKAYYLVIFNNLLPARTFKQYNKCNFEYLKPVLYNNLYKYVIFRLILKLIQVFY